MYSYKKQYAINSKTILYMVISIVPTISFPGLSKRSHSPSCRIAHLPDMCRVHCRPIDHTGILYLYLYLSTVDLLTTQVSYICICICICPLSTCWPHRYFVFPYLCIIMCLCFLICFLLLDWYYFHPCISGIWMIQKCGHCSPRPCYIAIFWPFLSQEFLSPSYICILNRATKLVSLHFLTVWFAWLHFTGPETIRLGSNFS